MNFSVGSGSLDGSDLHHEFEHADLRPMFGDPAIAQAVDVDFDPLTGCVGRWSSLKGTRVRRLRRATLDDGVIGGDQIQFRHDDIWKRRIHHSPDVLESSQARSHWSAKIVSEISGEQMIDPIDVVLVFENSGELPNCGLV
jgi:hypothetical protein